MCGSAVQEHILWKLKGWHLSGAAASEILVVVQEVFWMDDEVSS